MAVPAIVVGVVVDLLGRLIGLVEKQFNGPPAEKTFPHPGVSDKQLDDLLTEASKLKDIQ